jgi:hypothetical protein
MATQPVASKSPQRPTQAIGPDPAYRLDLGDTFQPDIDLVISEGVAVFGMKGSGKSNALARLLEQLRRFPAPYFVADTKGEYTSIRSLQHESRLVIATANDCPSGQEILTQRLQVVLDLRSWETDEGAALAIAQILNEMFAYASNLAPADCIPCPCFLDEAQYWLPQNPVPYLSKDVAQQLRSAWHVLATRARSLGLVPSYFTQNISEIHKSVMRQCGMYVLMRQFLDADLERYTEFVKCNSPAQLKKMIRSFTAGKAIVVMPDGTQVKTQFHPRETAHPSVTPTVRALVARLSEAKTTTKDQKAHKPRRKATDVTIPPAEPWDEARPTTMEEAREQHAKVIAALDRDSGLSPMELAEQCQVSLTVAKMARIVYFCPKGPFPEDIHVEAFSITPPVAQ